jgi:ubiquinone/menaquinone biosynthesis C-methylase UbiE
MAVQLHPARVLDLGCGAGHVSFALAHGGAERVTAYDPSKEMLAVVAQAAATRGFGQIIDTRVGSAEVLPFEANTFDSVVTRYSAHHWSNVPRALAECSRVTKPGGRLVVEFLRDASHVRDYRVSEWTAMQRAAGFAEPTVIDWKPSIDFKS